ncbi:MAG: hypothetical protein H6Q75_1704 [Firmicutes bacterium]|nr:hypothetical protein [Bacillota bacterium]
MPKSNYYPPKYLPDWSPPVPPASYEECPNHSDLYLLRDAAADERGAINDYLACALDTTGFSDTFLDAAEDEMQHFAKTMQLISCLDPIQAKKLEDEKLNSLLMSRQAAKPQSISKTSPAPKEEDGKVPPPSKSQLPAIRCLTKAIQDELRAINKYQHYMNTAEDSQVRALFCELMNEEKEHVAEFTAALFTLTHEPLPTETD